VIRGQIGNGKRATEKGQRKKRQGKIRLSEKIGQPEKWAARNKRAEKRQQKLMSEIMVTGKKGQR